MPAPGAAPPARASARILLIVLLPARLLLGLAAALLRPLASLVLPGRSGRRQHGSGPAPAAAGPHRPTPAAAGAALGAGLSFLSLRALGRIVVARTGGAAPGLLGAAVAHVAALGVLLSAAFGGFGSAALPHGCLEGMHLPPDLPALAVARVEEEARAAEGEAAARERTLAEAGTGAGAAGGLAVADGGGDLGTGGGPEGRALTPIMVPSLSCIRQAFAGGPSAAVSHTGAHVSLKDYAGKKLMLWFYPRAGTGG